MGLQVETPRIDRLKADLNKAKLLVRNNTQWNEKELSLALFGFCYGKTEEDILYVLACMTGRYRVIVQELEELISKLEEK